MNLFDSEKSCLKKFNFSTNYKAFTFLPRPLPMTTWRRVLEKVFHLKMLITLEISIVFSHNPQESAHNFKPKLKPLLP